MSEQGTRSCKAQYFALVILPFALCTTFPLACSINGILIRLRLDGLLSGIHSCRDS